MRDLHKENLIIFLSYIITGAVLIVYNIRETKSRFVLGHYYKDKLKGY